MGIYIERELNRQLDNEMSLLPFQLGEEQVTSMTGLMYYLYKNPVPVLGEFMKKGIIDMSHRSIQYIIDKLSQCEWLDDCGYDIVHEDLDRRRDTVVSIIRQFMTGNLSQQWIMLGDYYYDTNELGRSYYYYSQVDESVNTISVRCNIAILQIAMGQLEKGKADMMSLYEDTKDVHVLCRMVQCFTLYSIQTLEEMGNYIDAIIESEPDDDIFAFLMWYYELNGDLESLVTCFLQVTSVSKKLPYLKYYMTYLQTANLTHQMDSELAVIKDKYSFEFIYALGESYVMIGRTDEVIPMYQDRLTEMDVKEGSYHHLAFEISKGLYEDKQIILSLEYLNKIDVKKLKDEYLDKLDTHLINLANIAGSHSKELEIYQKMLMRWRKKYRHQYIYTLEQQWKGNS